jgi:hypothetical protein
MTGSPFSTLRAQRMVERRRRRKTMEDIKESDDLPSPKPPLIADKTTAPTSDIGSSDKVSAALPARRHSSPAVEDMTVAGGAAESAVRRASAPPTRKPLGDRVRRRQLLRDAQERVEAQRRKVGVLCYL